VKSASDIWVCGRCRSINPLSRGRCYRCNTPIEVAATKPEDLTFEHKEVAPEPTGVYRSAETRAVVVTIGTVAFIFATLIALWINWSAQSLAAAGDRAAANELVTERLLLLALSPITLVIAVVAYAFWIRRVIENLPALGVGYSRVSPSWAFFEPMIPGFNLFALPTRMAEAIEKLGPHPWATPLLGLAIIVFIGPALVIGYLIRFTRVFGSGPELRSASAVGLIVIFSCEAVALVLGLVIIWQIEGLQRRKQESLGGGAAP
jgi:hypothetical protein